MKGLKKECKCFWLLVVEAGKAKGTVPASAWHPARPLLPPNRVEGIKW